MAGPTVAGRQTSVTNADGTSHTVNFDAAPSAGQMLLVIAEFDGAPTVTWPSGWTSKVSTAQSTNTKMEARLKIADGTEGSSISLTTSASEQMSAVAFRIDGASTYTPDVATAVTGTTANPDPGAVTASIPSRDCLAITAVGSSSAVASAAPTGYTNLTTASTGTGNTNASLATAEKAVNGTSENPGAFTQSAAAFVAQTILVYPRGTVGVRSHNNGVSGSTNNYPSGLLKDDVLYIWARGSGMTPPAGFTEILSTEGGLVKVWRKVAAGTESGSFNLGGTVTVNGIVAVAGEDTSTPDESGQAIASVSGVGPAFASVTPTFANSMLLALLASSNTTATWTTPGTMTEVSDGNGAALATEQRTNTTATGTRTFSQSGSFAGGGALLVIRPPQTTIAPSGIASAEAVGTPSLTQIVAPSGVASGEVFGTATLVPGPVSIAPSGIATAQAFGTPFVGPPPTQEIVFEGTTNRITAAASGDFSDAYWAKTDSFITPDAIIAPDGSLTADKLREDSASSVHLIERWTGGLLSAGSPGSISGYAKAGERSWIWIGVGLTATYAAWINLATGTIGTVRPGVTATITPVGNGWYRWTVSTTSNVVLNTSDGWRLGLATGDLNTSYTGDGTSGVYIWHPQAEQKAYATPWVLGGSTRPDTPGPGSAEAFGTPGVKGLNTIAPSGIPSGEAFGAPTVVPGPVYITDAGGIASAEIMGFPTIGIMYAGEGLFHEFIGPGGILRGGVYVDSYEDLSEAGGGFISCSGRILESELRAFPDIYQQGTTWRVWDRGIDKCVFAGELKQPEASNGVAVISADGWGRVADRDFDDLLWQSRDATLWVAADSEPHGYDVDKQITAEVDGHRLVFKVPKHSVFRRPSGKAHLTEDAVAADDTVILSQVNYINAGDTLNIGGINRTVHSSYKKGDQDVKLTATLGTDKPQGTDVTWTVPAGPSSWSTGMVWWIPDVKPTRIAFNIDKNHGDTDYTLELLGATGPAGNLTLIDSWDMKPGGPKSVDLDLDGTDDLLMLRVKRTTEERTGKAFRVSLNNIRVNKLAVGDTYTVDEVLRDLFERAGATTDDVDTSTVNALPLHVQNGSAGQIADEAALLANWHWGIYATPEGAKRGEAAPWGSKTWNVTVPELPISLMPNERFNQVSLDYTMVGGIVRTKRVMADPNPFPAGYKHTYRIDMDEPPSEEIATAFGAAIADYMADLNYSGGGILTTVEDPANPGVPVSAMEVEPGDKLILTNQNNAIVKVAAIKHLTWGGVEAVFSTGNPILDKLLARRRRKLAMGQGQAQSTLGGLGLDRPAVPTNVTLGFKEVEKRGGRRKFVGVGNCDEVTEDVNGQTHAIRAYHWQFRPVDPGTEDPIPESQGGGIQKYHSTAKDDKDGEGDPEVPTEIISRALDHPHKWKWEMRVRAESVLDQLGAWSDWTPAAKPATFGPVDVTGVIVDVDQHKLRFVITADDPDETDADGDPMLDKRIAHYKYRLKKNGVIQTIGGRTIFRTKQDHGVIKLQKPGTATWAVEAKAVDHYGNASPNWVSGSGSKINPPAPSAPSLAFDEGGKERVRAVVTFSYSGVYTDDDIDHFLVRLVVNGRTMGPIKVAADDTLEAIFKGIREGRSCTAYVRAVDSKGHKSSWSSGTTATANDNYTPGAPTGVTVTPGLRTAEVSWTPPSDMGDVDHFYIELWQDNVFYKSAKAKGSRKSFVAPRGHSYDARMYSVSAAGNASSTAFSGASDLSPLEKADFQNDSLSDDVLDSATQVNFKKITGATFRTTSSGSRIAMVDVAGENDRLKVYGSSALAGTIHADSGDLLLDANTSAGAKVAIAGGLIVRSGSDVQIGDSDSNTNRMDYLGTTAGQATPASNHCYTWYDRSGTPKEWKVKFPNGTVKSFTDA